MKYVSTKRSSDAVSFEKAVLQSLPQNGGLYVPEHIPILNATELRSIGKMGVPDLAQLVLSKFIEKEIPDDILKKICEESFNIPIPLISLSPELSILELWHGETFAFKDFGARFMSRCFNYFLQKKNQKAVVLTATSGDTGGAVAAGFHNNPSVDVVILYPDGRVSKIQEKQLNAFGKNIHPIRIAGTFDDCQAMVKAAFVDHDLHSRISLSSANSISIARLLPQMIYYIAWWQKKALDEVLVVPSGNLGNITAGLIAKKMGIPLPHMILATNANDTASKYIKTGRIFQQHTVPTLSNAMDVAAPSNLDRIKWMYPNLHDLQSDISAISISDDETLSTMTVINKDYDYQLCPHTAVGVRAAMQSHRRSTVLATAHPIKFPLANQKAKISPPQLAQAERFERVSVSAPQMSNSSAELKIYLIQKFT